MMRIPILTVAVLVLLSACAASANASEIYQWMDEDGVVHFSDTAPENGAVVTTVRVQATNPPDYDPLEDPYSIRNQAERTNTTWTELEKARSAWVLAAGYMYFALLPATRLPAFLDRRRNAKAS